MNPDQIPQLIAQIALADPRIRRDDPTEQRAQILMWAGILADVPYEYAVTAVHQHYATSQWPILPANIATRWAATVRDRLTRHTGTFEPTEHPELDPDDEAGYRHALAVERQAVALGQQAPTPLAAITSGPAAEEVTRRLAALGDYLPTSVRDALADCRPAAAARATAIRAGRPDALAVPCPVETCRAAAKESCTRPGKGGRRHRLGQPHPSRTDAAGAAA
ncbi:hypothetical protein EDD93_3701 [Streptomyces sp. 840.1]|uniref:zinc finger domain-containing protein n=1 Tax=Streptomyces sp. 840.1 TaxID=2485152 RepID=UPI000F489AEA|nr:hypothetical protein [Streptomyces sp. 840.1]ROQ69204.1 hypothetical protein EDD93_3701 [Streptomyces sp. 840.1]